jgi:hypothetical protein
MVSSYEASDCFVPSLGGPGQVVSLRSWDLTKATAGLESRNPDEDMRSNLFVLSGIRVARITVFFTWL